MVAVEHDNGVVKHTLLVHIAKELSDRLIGIMNGFEIRAELPALKERCADLIIKTCLLVVFLILEIDLKVADSVYISKRSVVCEHKHLTHPLAVFAVDLLDLGDSLSEHRLIRKTETYRFIYIEICRGVIEFIVAIGFMYVEPVPVRSVVAVHTERIVAHILEQFLRSCIISVPVVYRNSTARCRHQRCTERKLGIRCCSDAFLSIEIGEIDALSCELVYRRGKLLTVYISIERKALDALGVDKQQVLARKHI